MTLSKDIHQKYIKAGKIAREVRIEIEHFVREKMRVIEVCERVENLIREKGATPAFPCNVSINEIAAHYTSPPQDYRIIPQNSIVKVDIGVHIDGYIADTAITICFDPEFDNLVRTAEEALDVAIKTIRGGISTSKLGSAIQKTIKMYGCKPVANLTGHQVGRYLIHTGKSIPNVSHLIGSKINEGEVIAIEPFVTVRSGAGKVIDGDEATIFRFARNKSLKNKGSRELLNHITDNFKTLPFAERWLQNVIPSEQYSTAFKELLISKSLVPYYVFIEANQKPVAQAEHTVLVLKDRCQVLT